MDTPLSLVLPALGACVIAGLCASLPADAARSEAARWADSHILSPSPAFSFTYGGKASSGLLPKWKSVRKVEKPDRARTRYITTYRDPGTGLAVRCTATVFSDAPAVEWVLRFTNEGTADTPVIEDVQALDVRVPGKEFVLHHSLGDSHNVESFRPIDDVVDRELSFAPIGGRSSEGHMPYFNLDRKTSGMIVAIGWAGQWCAGFKPDGDDAVRVRAGQELTHFRLHPGESVRTPSILLTFWSGKDHLAGNNIFRQLILKHYAPRRNGKLVHTPIACSVNEVDPGNNYEGPHLRVLPPLAERRIEVFWSDMDPQQWYPGEFPGGTGNWFPDTVKYPHGLKPIGDACRKLGMEYLLWFEPERVMGGTETAKLHPEYLMAPQPGEWAYLFKLHEPAARKWMTDYIDKQVTDAQLGWIRWDFNIPALGYWRRNDEPDRQGITEAHYIEGLYAMMDDFRARHPGLLIDICASGGRRLDFETCTRGIPLWHSDAQCCGKPQPVVDQLQNGGLWRWLPMHGCGNFATEPSYEFRSAMTAGNAFVPLSEKGLQSASFPETEKAVRASVALYKKLRPYMLGDFYPLFKHDTSEKVWYGYQFDLAGKSGCALLFRRAENAQPEQPVALRGIDPGASYEVSFQDTPGKRVVKGTELARYAVKIDSKPGSAVLFYKQVKPR